MARSSTYYVNRVLRFVSARSGYYMGVRLGHRVRLVELSPSLHSRVERHRNREDRDNDGYNKIDDAIT